MESVAVELDIEAIGVACSLGLDLPNAAAAYRAGISRGEPDDVFSVGDIDGGTGVGATIHAAPLISHGFEGLPRFLRLIEGALRDLDSRVPDQFWKSRLGVLPVLPHPKRRFLTFGLLTDEEERDEARKQLDEMPELTNALLDPLLREAFDVAEVPQPQKFCQAYTDGAVGFISALKDAAQFLDAGALDTALICCVDSFLDFTTLTWLESTGRLKTPDFPVGMQPGEAAAIIAVTRSGRSKEGIKIAAAASAQEGSSFVTGETSVGRALSDCVDACLKSNSDDGQEPIWFVSDLNGESYKAQEWGHNLVRLRETHQQVEDSTVWFPALGIGDVGAAFPATALGFVQQSIARGYAPASNALVCLGADHGPRGAYLVRATGGP